MYVVIFIKDLKTQLMFKLTCDRSDDAVDLMFAKVLCSNPSRDRHKS